MTIRDSKEQPPVDPRRAHRGPDPLRLRVTPVEVVRWAVLQKAAGGRRV